MSMGICQKFKKNLEIQYKTQQFLGFFLRVKRGDHPWEYAKIKWQCSLGNTCQSISNYHPFTDDI
jgi:hypothetical protein